MEKESYRKCTGIWIPIEIWEDDNLSRIERDALAEILHFNSNGGQCFASNSYFGKILKVTNGRVSQILKRLQDLGYISVSFSYKNDFTRQIDKRFITINYFKIYNEGDEEYEQKMMKYLMSKYPESCI